MKVTPRDRSKMRIMGYKYKVLFESPHGVPFTVDYSTEAEMNKYISSAKECGSKVIEILCV